MTDSFGPMRDEDADGAVVGVGPDAGSPRKEPIRVLVVDDHALFRRGLEIVLAAEEDIQVVGEATCVFSRTTRGPSPFTSSEPIFLVGIASGSSVSKVCPLPEDRQHLLSQARWFRRLAKECTDSRVKLSLEEFAATSERHARNASDAPPKD